MKNQRHVKNILINPGAQVRLFVPYFVMLMLAIVLLNGILFSIASTIYEVFPDMTPEQSENLHQLLFRSVTASVIGLAAMAFCGFLLTTVLSHRLLGPVVPIRRQIQRLIEGDYEDKIHLRKGDELHTVAEDINTLTEKLKQERGGSARH